MFDRIIERIFNFITSRMTVLALVFLILGGILAYRCFDLQIVHGQEYLEDFILQTEKARDISSSRGSVYDCNGVLLAYDELAYSVKIEDVIESGSGKNKRLNTTIYKLIQMIEKNGDKVVSDFHIILDESNEFVFDVEGTQLLRFLADVYGEVYTANLSEEQKNSTPWDVLEFLAGEKGTTSFAIGDYKVSGDDDTDFVVGKGYTREDFLKMVNIRYAMRLTSFRKYVGTVVAKDISDETVAVILENISELEGVSIVEDTVRRYNDSEYFAHILGYTGKISSEALETLNAKDLEEGGTGERYDINDVVGKSGIEEYMETTLQGIKGYEKVSVDNTGRVTSIIERKEASSGNDVYLTIDSGLQKAAYQILEQHIAGIVHSKIRNVKQYNATEDSDNSDIIIPIYDVYFAVLDNSVVDITHFTDEDAKETEKAVYERFMTYKEQVYEKLHTELYEKQTVYENLSREYKNYQTLIVKYLKSMGVLDKALINEEDATQIAWATEEVISLTEYLRYCIAMNWIDVTRLSLESRYSASDEIFDTLFEYIVEHMDSNVEFHKLVYKFMIQNDVITGLDVCKLLCEQNAINIPAEEEDGLYDGTLKPYSFMMNRIAGLDITPAQLALNPCSGTVVIVDLLGNVKALVTYPGYDNNKMANSVDPEYYAKLLADNSLPLTNYATRNASAPGSTFKPVSATAALCEGLVTLQTKTNCVGAFRYVNPAPYCWKRWGHGSLDVTGAISNSCNYFFYDVGYKFATESGSYVAEDGLNVLAKYARMYGLADKTGIEIGEDQPKVSDELPIPSAIGQGSNAYTAVGLARYTATIASSGTCYNLTLMDSVKDASGNLLKTFDAEFFGRVDMPLEYWDAIHEGMREVVEKKIYYNDLTVNVAGKTGTAEQSASKPNHALFIGYAPYEKPEIAITVKIPYGYSSDYAAKVSKDVLAYYYGAAEEEIITGTANTDHSGVTNNAD